MSSPLSSFSDPSWQVAREYVSGVIADIESGVKSWDTLANGLETDSIYMDKETIELRNKVKNVLDLRTQKLLKKLMMTSLKGPTLRKIPALPTTPNCSSEGCYWEHVNQGQNCAFDHFCSWCKLNQSLSCEFKPAE